MQTCLPSDNLLCYLNDLKLLISGHVLIEARKCSRMTIHTIIGKIILIECKIDFLVRASTSSLVLKHQIDTNVATEVRQPL